MNPNVAIATNPHSGISGRNTVWDQGVDYPGLLRSMDIVWTEEGNEAAVTDDGILVSKIRTYKMAASLGKRVLTYTAGAGGGKLQMAESMAYNRQGLGMIGSILAGYDTPPDERRYVQYFIHNFADYRDVHNIADVAVLQSHASMGFNNDLPWQSTMLLEQTLIQAGIPVDIIFDDQLRDLHRYRVLALADQECLSDEQIGLIRAFVRNGGGLVASESTSLDTNWRERRRDYGLKDLFHVIAPERREDGMTERALPREPVRSEFGRGRVVYIPAIEPAVPKPHAEPMISKYWKLPLNWKQLVDELRWAAGGDFSLELKALPTVTVELLSQDSTNTLFVHLLNYAVRRQPVVEGVELKLRVPDGHKIKIVELASPDQPAAPSPTYKVEGQTLAIIVPHLETYSVVKVKML